MIRYLVVMLCAFFVLQSLQALAQEEETSEPAESADTENGGEAANTEVPAAVDDEEEDTDADTADDEEIDDADLDEQGYEEDEEDFIPTEEIPVDEPIPFPSNI